MRGGGGAQIDKKTEMFLLTTVKANQSRGSNRLTPKVDATSARRRQAHWYAACQPRWRAGRTRRGSNIQ